MAISPIYENPARGTKETSKAPVRDTAQPPVRSGTVENNRPDKAGVGKGRGTMLSKESPSRVKGNLISAGRRDQGQSHDDAD
jgi:hypothetical protein